MNGIINFINALGKPQVVDPANPLPVAANIVPPANQDVTLTTIDPSLLPLPVTVGGSAGLKYFGYFPVVNAAFGQVGILRGSATKLVSVTRVGVSLSSAAGQNFTWRLERLSTAPVGGTPLAGVAASPADKTSGAATAAVSGYSAAPTAGTVAANLSSRYIGTGVTGVPVPVTFDLEESPIILRGVNDFLAITFAAGSTGGPITQLDIQWTES